MKSLEKAVTKQQTKPQPTVDSLPGMAEFADSSLLLGKKSLQANRLDYLRIPTVQRQISARQIGKILGNTYLQKILIEENKHQSNAVKQLPTNNPYKVQTYFNPVQLKDGRLPDRDETVQFTRTHTFQEFESEVRQWIAQQLISRTRGLHRERSLVPTSVLQTYYKLIHPGESITIKIHFISNGYSYRQITFSFSGEAFTISLSQTDSKAEQKQPSSSDNRFNKIEPLINLLRKLPVSTPKEKEMAKEFLKRFLSTRNTALESVAGKIPPVAGTILNVDSLIKQLENKEYDQAATSILSLGGNIAATVNWFSTVASEMGIIIEATSAAGQIGTVAGFIAEAAPLAGVALSVLIETAKIPSDVTENMGKIYYITDVSGILTSWIFNDPTISPHAQLMIEAKTGGYHKTDITDYVKKAHQTANAIWQKYFKGHPERVKHARQEVGGNYQACWKLLGNSLESKLHPKPNGAAMGMIIARLNGVEQVHKQKRLEESYRRRGWK